MGFYNLRVTGNPLQMPYQTHEEIYAMVPLFLWQKLPLEPKYDHKIIRDFHATHTLSFAISAHFLASYKKTIYPLLLLGVWSVNIFLIPVIIAFPVLMVWTLRNRWAHHGLLIQSVLVLGLLTEPFKYVHYLAPVTGLNYYFVLNAFRLARWRNKRVGDLMLWLTPLLAIAALLVALHGTINKKASASWQDRRAQLVKQLKQTDGKHLIIVTYGPRHSYHDEWVYNEADIDNAKVIFARAMDIKQDCELVEYFKSRRIWSLGIDDDELTPELKPYPISACN